MVVALPILGLSKDFKTKCCQAEEFRVSTIKESAHVNMSLFILKILLRGVVLSSRKLNSEEKMRYRFNIRATTAEGINGI